jgi:hypothetical protein
MNNASTLLPISSTTTVKRAADIVVAPEQEGAALAGKVVWWDLSGEVMLDTFNGLGLGDGLTARRPTQGNRLERAVKAAADRTEIVRPSHEGGLRIVREGVDEEGHDTYEAGLRVWIASDSTGAEVLRFSDPDHPKVPVIRERFAHFTQHLTSRDVSAWLTTVAVKSVAAVGLRSTGGYYFIPASHLGQWETIVAAVQSVTHHEFYDLPAHTKATAIKSVLKAIEAEAVAALDTIDERIAGGLSRRGLRGRETELEALTRKLMAYEKSLGVTLGAVRERADKLKSAVAMELLQDDD